jgi:hypothetical protein
MIVKRSLGNARRLGDVFDTARAEASLGELFHSGFENGITGGAARQGISFGDFSCPNPTCFANFGVKHVSGEHFANFCSADIVPASCFGQFVNGIRVQQAECHRRSVRVASVS